VGVYGDRGDERLDADSIVDGGWLAQLCVDWEAAAREAEALGARVALLRIGIVLTNHGGALARMLPAFELGVGGRLGSGKQWMSWIHLDDLVGLIQHALREDSVEGVLEACAPEPVTNRKFTRALATRLGRPAFVTVPRLALRLVFGGAARVILASQRVEARRTLASGYSFRHASLDSALAELADPQGVRIEEPEVLPDHPEVFPFFERPENLGPLTPPQLSFDIQGKLPEHMRAGAVIRYRIRLGPVPMGWETRILRHDHRKGFVDAQTRGPYRSWYHEHHFEAVGNRTRMIDEVHYSAPFGPIGRIANWLFVAPQLRRIFAFRSRAIRTRFGSAAAG
jgi:ligand-binding SRPBCC domain-containing protein